MKTDKHKVIISLLAQGYPYQAIADKVHCSKSTIHNIAEACKAEIAEQKRSELQEMYDTYYMKRTDMIKSYGTDLQRIEAEIQSRGLSEMSPKELLEAKDRTYQRLRDLYIPLYGKAPEATIEGLKTALCDYIDRIQQGEQATRLELQALQILGKTLADEEIGKTLDALKMLVDTKAQTQEEV